MPVKQYTVSHFLLVYRYVCMLQCANKSREEDDCYHLNVDVNISVFQINLALQMFEEEIK